MKVCSRKRCVFVGALQPLENFGRRNDRKSIFRSQCKVCDKERNKQYKEDHKEQINKYCEIHREEKNKKRRGNRKEESRRYRETYPEKIKKRKKEYNETHVEEIKEYKKQWCEKNKKNIILYKKEYGKIHRQKTAAREKQRRAEDTQFRLEGNLRSRLNGAIKDNFKSGSAVADLMMSVSDFKIYLEEKFYSNPDTGEAMTWTNYGRYPGWQIDHIVPLSSFDLTKREELLKACHYSNLRPLWAKRNLSENDRGMSRNKKKAA